MRRQIKLRAAGAVIDSGGYRDPGTSPYGWSNTPSLSLEDVFNTPSDAPVTGRYVYSWPVGGPQHVASFEPPPTLIRINTVTLRTAFDYSQAGPNNWWFPPDNAHGPGCSILLRKRDLSTYHVGTGGAAYQFVASDDNNVNTNTSPVPYKLYALSWELTSHPEGGPWTIDDIRDLAAGVQFDWALGPNGKAYDPAPGHGFFKIRAPWFEVLLDVEDLGGYVDNVRHQASLDLRLMRRARNVLRPRVFLHRAAGELFERAYFSHPKGAAAGGDGWGIRRLERRAGLVLQTKILPETLEREDEVLDLRAYSCLGWAAYRIDGPWSPELQGLALLDKGRSFTHSRAQDAWSRRPGDGALMRVLEAYPNLSPEGLAVSGGDDVAICLRNYDLMQSGWSTVASSGDFGVSAETGFGMAEEQGYLSCAELAYGAGGGRGGRERSLGTLPRASADRIHVRVGVRNSSVVDPVTQFGEFYLKRSGGGLAAAQYWDEAGRTWTTTPTYLAIPSDEPYGETVLDAVPCDAAGASSDPTYVIAVGRFSSNMGPVTLHGAIVDVQHTDDTVAGARPSLVTLDATITRVADTHRMDQVWGRELWVHERGTAVVELRPWWRAADLPADAVKPLLHAQHASAGTGTWQALQFVPQTGTDDLIRFEAAIDGEATYQLDCPITGIDLTRLHVLRAWARWLGPDGWTRYGPFSVELGWAVFLAADGSLVATASTLGRLASETQVPYAREWLGIGYDGSRQADGWVRMWESRRNPLHRDEAIWKV